MYFSKEELDIRFAKHNDSQTDMRNMGTFPSKHFLYHDKEEKYFYREMVKYEETILLKECFFFFWSLLEQCKM